ncbi:MAG: YlxR family protein [Lachnospiraceae bacterium]|nr:YlxR family protein [Lachnospiraceae bacterium]
MKSNKKTPLRQCIGCGAMKSKQEMLRVLKKNTGEIFLDITGRENGRGAYTCIESSCLINARKNKGLERSFKMRVSDDVYDSLIKEFDAIR